MSRAKKLPRLESLTRRRKRRTQSVEEQRTMLSMLSEQYGIPMTRGRRG